jgi:hypothetical protein
MDTWRSGQSLKRVFRLSDNFARDQRENIMDEQVRPIYPKKNGLTKTADYLPKKENSNNGNMLQIRNEKMKRLSNRVYCIRDVIG